MTATENPYERVGRLVKVNKAVAWIQAETFGEDEERVVALVKNWSSEQWTECARQARVRVLQREQTRQAVIERLEAPLRIRRELAALRIAERHERRAQHALAEAAPAWPAPPRAPRDPRICPICGGRDCRRSGCGAEAGIRGLR